MYTVILGYFGDDHQVFTQFVWANNVHNAIEHALVEVHDTHFPEEDFIEFKLQPYSVFAVNHGWQPNLV